MKGIVVKITSDSLKWPQIDFAMRYLWDNPLKYDWQSRYSILEFGTGSGKSLNKIINYLASNDWLDRVDIFGFDSWLGLPKEDSSVECFTKYTEGAYKYNKPYFYYDNIYLVDKWFSKLSREDAESIPKAILVHIDCDLYVSTKCALEWCFDNQLIGAGTLVAFDEYSSTNTSGSEQQAWIEVMDKYMFFGYEIWHSQYQDKDTGQRIRQNVWEVTHV